MSEEQQPRTEKELELELEQVRASNLEKQEQIADRNEKIAAAQRERKQVAFHENLRRAIAGTGLKTTSSVNQQDLFEALALTMEFDIASDGSFSVLDSKGRAIDFNDAYREWAASRTFWFDGRSLKRLETSPDDLCKSDMNAAEISAYIAKHGLAAFEKIPNVPKPPTPSVATMTGEQYAKLPASEKAKLIAKLGIAGIEEILRRK